jgi:hypothetical protein
MDECEVKEFSSDFQKTMVTQNYDHGKKKTVIMEYCRAWSRTIRQRSYSRSSAVLSTTIT